MKKILLMLSLSAMIMAGCGSDDKSGIITTKPMIENVKMPSGEFMANQTVTVEGKGFKSLDHIVFRMPDASLDSGIKEVVAEVLFYDATQLRFMVPSNILVGPNMVYLKRDKKLYALGRIHVVEPAVD